MLQGTLAPNNDLRNQAEAKLYEVRRLVQCLAPSIACARHNARVCLVLHVVLSSCNACLGSLVLCATSWPLLQTRVCDWPRASR